MHNDIRNISGNKINNENALAITYRCSNSQCRRLKSSSVIGYFLFCETKGFSS